MKYSVHGQIKIKGLQPYFYGDEILYISIRDSLRHELPCIELGSRIINLYRGQRLPIDFRCFYDPDKARMKFAELKTIPGGITISVHIERNEQLLYVNERDLGLTDYANIQLVEVD